MRVCPRRRDEHADVYGTRTPCPVLVPLPPTGAQGQAARAPEKPLPSWRASRATEPRPESPHQLRQASFSLVRPCGWQMLLVTLQPGSPARPRGARARPGATALPRRGARQPAQGAGHSHARAPRLGVWTFFEKFDWQALPVSCEAPTHLPLLQAPFFHVFSKPYSTGHS